MTAVLDASSAVLVVAQSKLPRDEVVRVREHLHEHYGVAAPALAAWEVGQFVFCKFPRLFGADARARAVVVDGILAGIDLDAPAAEPLRAAGALATARGLTFYDAAYLELAARDDASFLVTEDRPLRKAATRVLGPGRAYDVAGVRDAMASGEL